VTSWLPGLGADPGEWQRALGAEAGADAAAAVLARLAAAHALFASLAAILRDATDRMLFAAQSRALAAALRAARGRPAGAGGAAAAADGADPGGWDGPGARSAARGLAELPSAVEELVAAVAARVLALRRRPAAAPAAAALPQLLCVPLLWRRCAAQRAVWLSGRGSDGDILSAAVACRSRHLTASPRVEAATLYPLPSCMLRAPTHQGLIGPLPPGGRQ